MSFMKFSKSFERDIIKQAIDLVNNGKTEGKLEGPFFGDLNIFIDKKPDTVVSQYDGVEHSNDLKGKIKYVGRNSPNKEE